MSNVIDISKAIKPTKTLKDIKLVDSDDRKKSQSTLLIEIGQLNQLFHCPNRDGYAILPSKAVMPLRSKDFREHISHEFFKLTGKGCNTNSITDSLSTLESIAKFDSPEHDVFIRVANAIGKVVIDTGLPDWSVIEITANNWNIQSKTAVKFIRRRGALALKLPIDNNGDISLLKRYLNVEEKQLPLVIGWLLCAIAGVKPYPILILQGEQGTGKSTTSKVLRALVDPSSVPLRSPPKDTRDLLVSASNNHVVVLDNLSGISPEISDCLCRLSTGGGIDLRALYTDNEQVLIDIQRPVLINGIDDIATRPDLAERALIINLPVIDGSHRKGEKDFWRDFENDRLIILAALLNAVSAGIKHHDKVILLKKPRMADVAQWVTACERGLGCEGAFNAAHEENQAEAVELGLDASPIGSAIMTLMEERDRWIGKPTELMDALEGIASDSQTRSKAWPQTPKGLSNIIKRLMPGLRAIGISVDYYRTMTARQYKLEKFAVYPSYPSYPSLNPTNPAAARAGGMTDSPDSMTDSRQMTDSMTDSPDSMTDSKTLQATNGAGYDTYDGYDGYKPNFSKMTDRKPINKDEVRI